MENTTLNLQQIMHLFGRSERTIISYIAKGILPQPTTDGKEMFFSEEELKNKLNVTSLSEPFIGYSEVAKILGVDEKSVVPMCMEREYGLPLPYYTLEVAGGKKILGRLFRASEIRDWQKARIVMRTNFMNNSYYNERIVMPLLEMLAEVFHEDRETQVFLDYLRGTSLEETGAKFDLTRERVRQIKERAARRFPLMVGRMKNLLRLARGEKTEPKIPLSTPVADLGLSVRAMEALASTEINNVGELASHTENELLKYRTMGKRSLEEIQNVLQVNGLYLGYKP